MSLGANTGRNRRPCISTQEKASPVDFLPATPFSKARGASCGGGEGPRSCPDYGGHWKGLWLVMTSPDRPVSKDSLMHGDSRRGVPTPGLGAHTTPPPRPAPHNGLFTGYLHLFAFATVSASGEGERDREEETQQLHMRSQIPSLEPPYSQRSRHPGDRGGARKAGWEENNCRCHWQSEVGARLPELS